MMANFEIIRSAHAPEAIGPYSQALAFGELVFCAGQIPLLPGTRELKNANIEEATRQTLHNLRAVLAAAGCGPQDVIKTTVFLADLQDFAGMNAAYAEFFGAHRPARSTIQAAALPLGARVEIDALAVRSL